MADFLFFFLLLLSQSTGAYKAASRLASATPPPSHVLSRGIGWQVCLILYNTEFRPID